MHSTRLISALPFWLSLGFAPLIAAGAAWGGWWLLLIPLYAFGLITILDFITGLNSANPQIDTPVSELFWYRLITLVWFPVQMALIFGALYWVTHTDHLRGFEVLALFYSIGIASGAVGIVYAHELMHQKSQLERWLADLLLASVLYSHFRSEHLRVHHLWVGTPRDPVTARYNEGFWRFFTRVLLACPRSAWRAEVALLARGGRSKWSASNPFWRYATLQVLFLALAWGIGGGIGVLLFLFQAFVAVLHLELTNYVEHYGLTRLHLGDGRYEHVLPRHSWNAAHRASNWLLINLQRHSDHHYKPDRRFPLLQTYDAGEAPQLPLGYPTMVVLAAFPPVWRRLMNPRVREWRRRFYPQVTDWSAYKSGSTPMPKGAR
ncbi:alkane 1-monooxygenase [Pararhodobacter oceanensis]|uniref:Alkane 1-monooxygenase n=1 Tax=Pararhodobacter oceanensis TaxID=2172121 RepID=A0A2T8HS83_9RHOB|nr:alkane 1-monooxygenase [Pararhodobacter oceanensis]PVH28300.1 alkane 1-monooxygenase [Pararhodobacter oceanensis]